MVEKEQAAADALRGRLAELFVMGRSWSSAAAPGRARDGSFVGELLASVLGHEMERENGVGECGE